EHSWPALLGLLLAAITSTPFRGDAPTVSVRAADRRPCKLDDQPPRFPSRKRSRSRERLRRPSAQLMMTTDDVSWGRGARQSVDKSLAARAGAFAGPLCCQGETPRAFEKAAPVTGPPEATTADGA